jgi:hypothetical protein
MSDKIPIMFTIGRKKISAADLVLPGEEVPDCLMVQRPVFSESSRRLAKAWLCHRRDQFFVGNSHHAVTVTTRKNGTIWIASCMRDAICFPVKKGLDNKSTRHTDLFDVLVEILKASSSDSNIKVMLTDMGKLGPICRAEIKKPITEDMFLKAFGDDEDLAGLL